MFDPKPDLDKLAMLRYAIMLATDKHGMQLDKTNHLYILHPLAVMGMMDLDDTNGKIVAVMHDVIEDTDVTLDELIDHHFPEYLINAIDAITMRKGKETYREYLARCKADPIAKRVKLNDMKHNSSPERTKGLRTDEADYLKKKYEQAIKTFEEA